MGYEQEEAIMRITARYVMEVRLGKQPRLSEYIARYPQYAAALADFVAYYHAVELPQETEQGYSVEPTCGKKTHLPMVAEASEPYRQQ